MNETLVTMVGNVASTVTYTQTAGGVPVANFRMATTERRYDRGKGDWVDGDTTWVTVVAWRWLATNLVSSVNKGDPVVVSGRLRVREWGEEDKRRTVVEIDARSVGHDLSRGPSTAGAGRGIRRARWRYWRRRCRSGSCRRSRRGGGRRPGRRRPSEQFLWRV